MISVYNIKPKFQQLLKPVLEKLFKAGVTANQITIAAIALSMALSVGFWFHPYGTMFLILPAGLFFRMALNALDGMMARNYNMQSKIGEVLNEFGDVVSDLFIYLSLIKLQGVEWHVVVGFSVLAVLNEFAGVLAKVIGGERRYDGPMGKSDRAFLVGLICLVYYFYPSISLYINYIFAGAILLLIISTFSRLKNSLKK
jgi:CDP-diacylglycerol--glycerol-3-phosphate 3-phosphatidyltransferase